LAVENTCVLVQNRLGISLCFLIESHTKHDKSPEILKIPENVEKTNTFSKSLKNDYINRSPLSLKIIPLKIHFRLITTSFCENPEISLLNTRPDADQDGTRASRVALGEPGSSGSCG
jgi:hypothetical protein